MSKTTFPDIIGPSVVSANSGTAIGIRNKVLNIASAGVTAVDNPGKHRTDLTIADPDWTVVTASTVSPGDWMPALLAFAAADVVRVQSSVSGTQLNGLDSNAPEEDPTDPTHLVKFIANIGSTTITIQEPSSPGLGKQYYTGNPYTLAPSHTVRMTWDSVDRVYRIAGTASVNDYVTLDSVRIVLDGNPILNPED